MLARYNAEDKDVTVKPQGLINAEVDGNPDLLNGSDLTRLLEILAGLAE